MGEMLRHVRATGHGVWVAIACLALLAAVGIVPADAQNPSGLTIESLELQAQGPGSRLRLQADGPVTWTSFRDTAGDLVIELPNSLPAAGLTGLPDASDPLVRSVSIEHDDTGLRPVTRLVVASRAAVEHVITADGSELWIDLVPVAAPLPMEAARVTTAAAGGSASAPPSDTPDREVVAALERLGTAEEPQPGVQPSGVLATRLAGVEVVGGESTLRVMGDGAFEYETFYLDDPPRVVIDLQGVVDASPQASVEVASGPVDRVRMAQFQSYPERVARVVIDLAEPAVPVIRGTSDGLEVAFGAAMPAAVTAAELEAEVESTLEIADAPAPDAPAAAEAVRPLAEPVAASVVASEPPMAEAEATVAQAAATEPEDLEPLEEEVVDAPRVVEATPVPAPDLSPERPAPVTEIAVTDSAVTDSAATDVAVTDVALYEAAQLTPETPASATRPVGRQSGSVSLGAPEKTYAGELMTLTVKDADIKDILRVFAEISGLNVVVQPGVTGSVTVELRQVPWDQALEQILKINSLGYELEGNIMRVAPLGKLREEAEEAQRLKAAQSLAIPLRTVIQRVSYANAQELANILGRSVLSQRGSVIVDGRTNTLIVKELPDYMDTVIALIENLDTPEPQVMIEARIVETTKRFTRTLGVNWGFEGIASPATGNPTGLQFPANVNADGGVNLLTGAANGILNVSMGNVLNTFNLDATLQAAETEGLINILSAPRVATLNNEQASIQSGLQIPIQTVANNTVSVQFVNATLRLDVTPQVTAEGTVLMQINIQKREPQLAFAVVGATNAPIATKEARTRVIVRDGGTTVIGGIYEVSTDQGEDRVPGMANVPILGHLFKNKRRTDENEELLIFITPRVIKL